ncbi:hypothetical protein ACFVYE_38625 [Streptomyces sp. NPDC058239]|uniref:hypothetical protein n=1 Tax=Streptomyces sp. NPDC058239 TaxID=3346395 RepID=UPI0036E98CA3
MRPNGIWLPDDCETLANPATAAGELTRDQAADAAPAIDEMGTTAIEWFVMRTVVNNDLVMTAPHSGSGPMTFATRNDSDQYQHWTIAYARLHGEYTIMLFINRATNKGIGRDSKDPYLRDNDPSDYAGVGGVLQPPFPQVGYRITAVMTREPVECPAGEDPTRLSRAMAPVDPRAQEVKFSAKGPDGKSVGLTVDLLNDACDGPRTRIPTAIWKVVALAATSAGDVGITYAPPGRA